MAHLAVFSLSCQCQHLASLCVPSLFTMQLSESSLLMRRRKLAEAKTSRASAPGERHFESADSINSNAGGAIEVLQHMWAAMHPCPCRSANHNWAGVVQDWFSQSTDSMFGSPAIHYRLGVAGFSRRSPDTRSQHHVAQHAYTGNPAPLQSTLTARCGHPDSTA